MTNPYTEKYNKASDSAETVASKSIDIISNSILVLNQGKEIMQEGDQIAWIDNSEKVSQNFTVLLSAVSAPELGDFGAYMQALYFNLSMKHNILVLDGYKDEAKVDEVIDKFQEIKDFWIKISQVAPAEEKKETDLI